VINNSILYAAIMLLWFVALPSFQIISSVLGIVSIMSFVFPAAACYLFWVRLEPL